MRKLTLTTLLLLLSTCFLSSYADTFIAGFETSETGYTVNTEWYTGYEYEITDNTETSGINNSDKCLMTTITGAAPDRWGLWVIISMESPVLITEENRYVKVMAKRTPNTTPLGLHIKGEPWGEGFYFGQTKPAKAGLWGDVVFDLFRDDPATTCENREIQHLMICLGTWDGTEAGVCMLDNIVLSDNPKPRGAQEIAPGLLLDFENEELTNKNFAGFEVQSAEAASETVNNPVKNTVNPTAKCLEYSKPANTTWWHASRCIVNGIIPVSVSDYYLHIMMYIPDASPVTIMAKSPSGKQADEKFYPMDGEGWYDYVLDVSSLDFISEISFRFNNTQEEDWENPAGKYYIDDFFLDGNFDARETTSGGGSGVNNPVLKDLNIYVANGSVTVSSPELSSVGVYSLSGQLISTAEAASNQVVISLNNGVYIIKIEDKNGYSYNEKIIVK